MLRSTLKTRGQYRAIDNLPAEKLKYGRQMTGYITPYRHWKWKQGELWRNVHEAQFEHLRRVYKRQWLESWRVNADEYIHKYNITKAATLTRWENEMHAQDAKRLDKLNDFRARQKLKSKHRDLYKEIHEREFFHWYEKASERLQAMTRIPFIPREKISDHIERELNKYVVGKSEPYPLNFVGQMPVLEDKDGNIAEVPGSLYSNFISERPTSNAKQYEAPKEASLVDQLTSVVSGEAHGLFDVDNADVIETMVLDEMAKEAADSRDAGQDIAEQTPEEIDIERRAFIERGKHGTKVRSDFKSSARTVTITPQSTSQLTEVTSNSPKKKKSPPASGGVGGRAARQKIIENAINKKASATEEDSFLHKSLAKAADSEPKIGEIATRVPKLRSRLKLPSLDEVMANPIMAAQASSGSKIGDVAQRAKKDAKRDQN